LRKLGFMMHMPKIKDKRHLAKIYKNRDCATFGKLMMNSYFLGIDFSLFFIFLSFLGNFPRTALENIVQLWGTGKRFGLVHYTVSKLWIAQFLGSVLGYLPWLHSFWAQGRNYSLYCTIPIINVGFPSWIVQFLEASPKLL